MTVEVHSISLDHCEAFLENHAAYSKACALHHVVHRFSTPRNSNYAKTLFKYAVIEHVLCSVKDGTVVIFVDDSVAFHKFEPLPELEGIDGVWAIKAPHNHRVDGALIALRAGPDTRYLVSQIRDTVRGFAGRPDVDLRWDYDELDGLSAFEWNTVTSPGAYLMLPFAAYGVALPVLSVHALSFNPLSHANEQDWRTNDIAVRHITEACEAGRTPFESKSVDLPALVSRPSRDLALVTAVTPSTYGFARFTLQRLADYCERQAYELIVGRYPDDDTASANWRKADLLMDALEGHCWAIWCDADILIYDLDQALVPLFGDASVVMVRDISGYLANSGLIAVRNDLAGRSFLQDAAARMEAVEEKGHVYASGGDQPFFIEAFTAVPSANRRLLDVAAANTHPAVAGTSPFMLHYMGYPNHLRALVIKRDYEASAPPSTTTSPPCSG